VTDATSRARMSRRNFSRRIGAMYVASLGQAWLLNSAPSAATPARIAS
jgi:hypothetical protein